MVEVVSPVKWFDRRFGGICLFGHALVSSVFACVVMFSINFGKIMPINLKNGF